MPGLSSLRMRRPRLTFTMAFSAPAFGAGLPAPSLIARAAAGAPQARGYQRSRSSRLPAVARRTGLGWSLLRLRAAPQRRRPTPTIPGLVQQLRAFRARCSLCSGLAASLGIPGGSRAAHPVWAGDERFFRDLRVARPLSSPDVRLQAREGHACTSVCTCVCVLASSPQTPGSRRERGCLAPPSRSSARQRPRSSSRGSPTTPPGPRPRPRGQTPDP